MEKEPPEQEPQLNEAQEIALRGLCRRYEVSFDPSHYLVHPDDSFMLPGWCEGWVGGARHVNPQYGEPEQPPGQPTIYVGVSREGEVHS